MPHKRLVAIGLIGPTLDGGKDMGRWEKWRPTVALHQHEDLLIERFELLYQRKFSALAELLEGDIRAVSPETDVRNHVVEYADPWDFEEVYGALHDFARGYPFDTEREDYLVHITTGSHVAQICLFLLTESRHLPGCLLQTSPPERGRQAPAGSYQIVDLDLSRYDRIAERFRAQSRAGVSFLKAGIETRNRAFNRLIERIEQVAIASRAPLLLTGPTGAGKTVLARRIYELKSARHQVRGAYVEVNCATLRGDGAMSTLFGHVKGAFTGAVQERAGLLRAADGGLLFLDEIGELGLDEQAMLLRALEAKRFLPVGSDREAQSDFQLLAGTNRDLGEAVRAGRFREDLLSRINLWTFRMPSLAERLEDLEPNLGFELEQFAGNSGTRVSFNKEARERYLAFATSPEARWSGNFRDLNASVIRMATFASGGRIGIGIIEEELEHLRAAWRMTAPREPGEQELEPLLGAEGVAGLDRFDRVQLADVVRVCREAASISEAGRRLFAVSRTEKKSSNDADRLRKYLARFGLDWKSL
jgi:transcriptional regulatory protein RtcR